MEEVGGQVPRGSAHSVERAVQKTRDVQQLVAAERAARIAGESTARWWRDLTGASASARTEHALDALLRSSFVTMKAALNADAVSVLVANEAGDELVARASNGLSEEITLDLGIRSGKGMSGRVIATRQPLLVDDLSTIDVVSPVLRHSGLRSVAAVPILFEQRVLGVLYVGSRKLAHFDELDIELLELMAERLAIALERVHAFEAERAARVRAERDADHLSRLQAVTARLSTAASTEEIAASLTASLDTVGSVHEQGMTTVWLKDKDGLVLLPTPGEPPLGKELAVAELEGNGPLSQATLSRQPAYIEDSSYALCLGDGTALATSSAVLPLVVRGELLGALVVSYRGRHIFEPDERDFLRSVAEQTAQALDRARLYAEQVALAEANSFLAQAAKAMAEGSDFKDTLDRLASLVLGVVGDICLIDVVTDNGALRRMVARHRDEREQALVDRLSHDPPDPRGAHPAAQVIRTGETRWSADMGDGFLLATTRDQTHYSTVKALRFRSYVAVPLTGGAGVLGALTVVSVERSLTQDDVAFAERLAGHVAAVVDNARRYEATLQTSQILQQSLLPQSLPFIPGLAVAVRYLPATRGLEVGGDFYDLVCLADGQVDFMIGDVAGHDREAAALMGQLRSVARVLLGRTADPSELVRALQASWSLLGFDRLATALFGKLNLSSGELTIASAGHERPLLVEPSGTRYLPVEPSPALGVPVAGGTTWRGTLAPGQVLVLYTDGTIEERDIGVNFGLERLAKAAGGGRLDPESVCDRVVAVLPANRHDDVALLALARLDGQ
jgi:serine/threonine-protein kinase RsbW